jgi:dihydrofolate reductase
MRKIVMFNLVSADGYFARRDGSLDWFVWDADLDRFSAETIQRFDTVLLGRTTYQLFADYWPRAAKDPATKPDDKIIADRLDAMTKIVFSTSLERATWQNSRLLRAVEPAEIEALKRQAGSDIVVYGSGSIVRQLSAAGLIDEYRFIVNPVILGDGRALFDDPRAGAALELGDIRQFPAGNVQIRYRRSQRPAAQPERRAAAATSGQGRSARK